jgi:hypothetical protein
MAKGNQFQDMADYGIGNGGQPPVPKVNIAPDVTETIFAQNYANKSVEDVAPGRPTPESTDPLGSPADTYRHAQFENGNAKHMTNDPIMPSNDDANEQFSRLVKRQNEYLSGFGSDYNSDGAARPGESHSDHRDRVFGKR